MAFADVKFDWLQMKSTLFMQALCSLKIVSLEAVRAVEVFKCFILQLLYCQKLKEQNIFIVSHTSKRYCCPVVFSMLFGFSVCSCFYCFRFACFLAMQYCLLFVVSCVHSDYVYVFLGFLVFISYLCFILWEMTVVSTGKLVFITIFCC